MSWQYSFEFYPYEIFREEMIGERRRVFSCKAEKECRVEERYPEFNRLVEMFHARGKQGLEVVQVFFQEKGVLVLYKKVMGGQECLRPKESE